MGIAGAVVLVVVIILAGLALAGARPRANTVDEMESGPVDLPPPIKAFVDAVHNSGSEGDTAYLDAVAALRSDPAAAARTIAEAFSTASPAMRPALVLAAGAAQAPALRPFLACVASAPPSRRGAGEDSWLVEASMLRLMAVDGLEALTAKGDGEAAADLERLVESPDLAVQAAAVVALKYGPGGAERLGRLRGRIAPERRFLLDLRRADVREVPQVSDPRRHLAVKPHSTDGRPAIGENRDASLAVRRRGHAPRVPGGR